MDSSAGPDEQGDRRLSETQSVRQLLQGAFGLHRRYTLLFFALATAPLFYDLLARQPAPAEGTAVREDV